jgi:hypothetical protein
MALAKLNQFFIQRDDTRGTWQRTAYVNYNIKSSNQLNSDIINMSFVPFWNVLLNP